MKQLDFTLEHIGLPALDPVKLKDWYIHTLGAKLRFDNGQVPPAFFIELPGGVMLEIYKSNAALKGTSDNSVAGWRHAALRVGSIEAAKKVLAARGVRFPDPAKPAGGGGRVLFFSDPEGNLLHLVERPKDSVFHAPAKS